MGSKRPVLLFVLSIAAILPLSAVSLTFRSFDHGGFSRFVIEGDSPFAHSVVSTPAEIQVTLDHAAQLTTAPVPIRNSQLLEGFQHQIRDGHSVVTIRLRKPVRIRKNFVLESPFRVVFDLVPAPASQAAPPPKRLCRCFCGIITVTAAAWKPLKKLSLLSKIGDFCRENILPSNTATAALLTKRRKI